jgi:hypothetical protein
MKLANSLDGLVSSQEIRKGFEIEYEGAQKEFFEGDDSETEGDTLVMDVRIHVIRRLWILILIFKNF